jgi:hypothetical protein
MSGNALVQRSQSIGHYSPAFFGSGGGLGSGIVGGSLCSNIGQNKWSIQERVTLVSKQKKKYIF